MILPRVMPRSSAISALLLTAGLLCGGCSLLPSGDTQAPQLITQTEAPAEDLRPTSISNGNSPSVVGAWSDASQRGWVLVLHTDGTYVNAHDTDDAREVYRGSFTYENDKLSLRRESPTVASIPPMTLRLSDSGAAELIDGAGTVRWIRLRATQASRRR